MVVNKRPGTINQYATKDNAKEKTSEKVSFFFHVAKLII